MTPVSPTLEIIKNLIDEQLAQVLVITPKKNP